MNLSHSTPPTSSPHPFGLSASERSALRRVALGRGDLTPVHEVHAHSLERRELVRIVPPTLQDRAVRLAKGETWCVITDHGKAIDAMIGSRQS